MWQHFTPQVLLKRFANERGLLTRIPREGRRTPTRPYDVCAVEDFYRLDAPGMDPNHYEQKLDREIERPAGGAFRAVVSADGFPPRDDVRQSLARFIAVQLVRGPERRDQINAMAEMAARVFSQAKVPSDSPLRREFLPFDETGEQFTQNALVQMIDEIAPTESLLGMRFALVRFAERTLVVADSPVVPWFIGTQSEGFGVGIEVPHSMSFHLDSHHALLGVPEHVHKHTWTERTVQGTPEIARVLNERMAAQCWEQVFHHPDHRPLEGFEFPPRFEPRDVLGPVLAGRPDVRLSRQDRRRAERLNKNRRK